MLLGKFFALIKFDMSCVKVIHSCSSKPNWNIACDFDFIFCFKKHPAILQANTSKF